MIVTKAKEKSPKKRSHASSNQKVREKKARRIIRLLSEFTNLGNCDILDIGTGSGYIVHTISKECRSATSIDVCDERIIKDGYSFILVKDEHLPFPDESFNVVISNQVLEHVKNQELHITEIHRVLKKDGLAYLATPNKYWIIEPHYHVPFLSYMPKMLENRNIRLVSFKQLEKLAKNRFKIYNLTPQVIKRMLLNSIPLPAIRLLNKLFPSYILVLKKL